jgi:hypothetical protein
MKLETTENIENKKYYTILGSIAIFEIMIVLLLTL